MLREKIINVIKIDSEHNVADILTKALGRDKFEFIRNEFNIA